VFVITLNCLVYFILVGYAGIDYQVAAAIYHRMAGLLLFEDTLELGHRSKKCGNKAPHVVIRTAGGSDPLTPGFPSIGK